jgi:hypothetical protein
MQTAAQTMAKVKAVVINVYAEKSEGGPVTFRHEWKFDGDPGMSKGTINVPPGTVNAPPTRMQFHLHDSTGLHLQFVNPTSDAMWVSLTKTCPDEAGDGGQISYNHPWNAKLLQVDDANQGPPCTLYYTLRFDGDPYTDPDGKQHPPYEYDPDIKNGGGTVPNIDPRSSTITVIAVTAAVVAVIAAILWLT